MLAGQRSESLATYISEATRCLAAARRAANWAATQRFRERYDTALRRDGDIQALLAKVGYDARRIVNTEPKRPGGNWQISHYRFLP